MIRLFALVVALLVQTPVLAETGHDHAAAKAKPPSAEERQKMWLAALARPALAATAVFDSKGRLWRTFIRDRFLLVSYSDDEGRTFSSGARVNTTPEHIAADGENRPKIVVAPDGALYVSYTQALDVPMTGHIRFSRSLDGGRTFSVPITVNDDLDVISHRFEAMGVDGRGKIYLAWLDKRDLESAKAHGKPYTGAAIYYAVSSDRGATFAPNRKLADHTCECCRVTMASDDRGPPVVVWRHVFGANIRDHALARLEDNATVVRATRDDWAIDACPHHGPAVSIAADGAYHLVWFTNAPGRSGLYYARSNDAGAHWSEPMAVGDTLRQPSHPHVLAHGRSIFIAWKEFDGQTTSAQTMHSSDGGKTWSPATKMATTKNASDHPFIVRDRTSFYVAWNTLDEGLRMNKIAYTERP